MAKTFHEILLQTSNYVGPLGRMCREFSLYVECNQGSSEVFEQ